MSESIPDIFKFELWSITFDAYLEISVFARSLSEAKSQLRFILGDVLSSKCIFVTFSD